VRERTTTRRPDWFNNRVLKPETLGRPFVNMLIYWRGVFYLLRYTLTHLSAFTIAPVRAVFERQIYFTGIQALGAISYIALIAGAIIIGQITSLIGSASPQATARVLLWVLVRELGPLLSAIIVIARSSAATASELALMGLRGELDSLRRMGIEPFDYLIVPRITGMTLATAAVTVYFLIIAVVSGFVVVWLTNDVSFGVSIESVVVLLTPFEVLMSLLKGFVFGLTIAATSCLYGLRVESSVTDVPRAVTSAVLRNVITVFVLDAIITYLFFL
jgi:phospholipid/cholesterol/gamma-HCH transport system permease protein